MLVVRALYTVPVRAAPTSGSSPTLVASPKGTYSCFG